MKYDPAVHVWSPLSVSAVATLFAGAAERWWLSGGYAIEHRLGRATRSHGDIDVSVVRSDWAAFVARLPASLEAVAAMDGWLLPLAAHADDPSLQNIFVRDVETGRWVLQINLEEGDALVWRYRRDPRVTLPWDRAVSFVDPLPTGSLATQLLFKSRQQLPKDNLDLAAAWPAVPSADRAWLTDAIRFAHPDSAWLTTEPFS